MIVNPPLHYILLQVKNRCYVRMKLLPIGYVSRIRPEEAYPLIFHASSGVVQSQCETELVKNRFELSALAP